jgi:hypothetical protein
MNAQQKNLLNFVRKLNINILTFEELEDQDSPLVSFINSFTLNYIVSRLNQVDRQEFVDLPEHETNDYKVWRFVSKHIKNFDDNYEDELAKKLRKIKNKLLNSNKE